MSDGWIKLGVIFAIAALIPPGTRSGVSSTAPFRAASRRRRLKRDRRDAKRWHREQQQQALARTAPNGSDSSRRFAGLWTTCSSAAATIPIRESGSRAPRVHNDYRSCLYMTGCVQTRLKASGWVDIVVLRTLSERVPIRSSKLGWSIKGKGADMVRAQIIIMIAVIALSGCASSDERAFNAAAKQNTIESYSEFLNEYPDSPHRSEALALKDDATFAEVKRVDSKHAYDAYLSYYPTGRHVTEAKALREQIVLREQQRRCKYAKAAGNTYKGVVAALNGLLAFARGDDVVEDSAWGWNAASNQLGPKAIDTICD